MTSIEDGFDTPQERLRRRVAYVRSRIAEQPVFGTTGMLAELDIDEAVADRLDEQDAEIMQLRGLRDDLRDRIKELEVELADALIDAS